MRAAFLFTWALMLASCQQIGLGQPPAEANVANLSEADRVLRVEIPSRGARADLALVGTNGDVETWIAVDNISLSFNSGILVASRGLGFDLMGAGAESTLAAIRNGQSGIYRRQMRYLTGDNRSTYLQAGCTMIAVGPDELGGRSLERFEEECLARQHKFTNIFWLASNGEIVESRQWLSPENGYVSSRQIEVRRAVFTP